MLWGIKVVLGTHHDVFYLLLSHAVWLVYYRFDNGLVKFYDRYADDSLVWRNLNILTLFCVNLTASTVTSVLRSTSLKMKTFISLTFLLTELLRIFTGKTRTLASMSLSPVMNLGLLYFTFDNGLEIRTEVLSLFILYHFLLILIF